jgi:hypothetical protein
MTADPTPPRAAPRPDAMCARCQKPRADHIHILDWRGTEHYFCYEFTVELVGEDAVAEFVPPAVEGAPHRCTDPARCTICSPTMGVSIRLPAPAAVAPSPSRNKSGDSSSIETAMDAANADATSGSDGAADVDESANCCVAPPPSEPLRCPQCGAEVDTLACTHCGHQFVPPAPASSARGAPAGETARLRELLTGVVSYSTMPLVLNAALTEVEATLATQAARLRELEAIERKYGRLRDAVNNSPDECGPDCGQHGHGEVCPRVDPAIWLERQQARLAELEETVQQQAGTLAMVRADRDKARAALLAARRPPTGGADEAR